MLEFINFLTFRKRCSQIVPSRPWSNRTGESSAYDRMGYLGYRGHYRNEAVTFGWTVCRRSPFTSCRNEDPSVQMDVQVEYLTAETEEPDYSNLTTEKTKSGENATAITKFAAVVKDGFSLGANYDLFSDLDDDTLQASFLEEQSEQLFWVKLFSNPSSLRCTYCLKCWPLQ